LLLAIRYALRGLGERSQPLAKPLDRQWAALTDGSYVEYFERLYTDSVGFERLQRAAKAMQTISRAAGVPLVTTIFPLFIDLGAYRLTHLHQRVAELFQASGVKTYDLLPLYSTMYRRHGALFILNALHPNPLGHRLVALYLLHALRRDGLLPASTAAPTPRGEFAQLDQLLEPVIAATEQAAPSPSANELPPETRP
jgi:hypothetical protein